MPGGDRTEPLIRVVIACGRDSSCKALEALLSTHHGIEIVAETSTGRGAVALAERFHPDLVLVDAHTFVMNGIKVTSRIKRQCPDVGVIVMSIHKEIAIEARAVGADGFIDIGAEPSALITAIQVVAGDRAAQQEMNNRSQTMSEDKEGEAERVKKAPVNA